MNQARRLAITDARDQAAAYADATDFKFAEIVAITDGEAAPAPRADGEADLPTARFVNIPPQTIEFDSSVQVTWRIAPR